MNRNLYPAHYPYPQQPGEHADYQGEDRGPFAPADYRMPVGPHAGFAEGQRETLSRDALRWGDNDNVGRVITAGDVAAAVPVVFPTKQLIRAHSHYPQVWLLMFDAGGDLASGGGGLPAGEVANVTVEYQITIGAGQGQRLVRQRATLTSASGWAPVVPPLAMFVPAGDLQVLAIVSYTPTVAGTVRFSVGAFTGIGTDYHNVNGTP